MMRHNINGGDSGHMPVTSATRPVKLSMPNFLQVPNESAAIVRRHRRELRNGLVCHKRPVPRGSTVPEKKQPFMPRMRRKIRWQLDASRCPQFATLSIGRT